MYKQGFIRGRTLEAMLYLTAAAFVAGHVVNRLTSPRPLNPLWNRISAFAASRYGCTYVTAGIVMFAICLLLFGVIALMQCDKSLLARAGSICIAASSLPMAFVAAYPTFTPGGELVSKREVPFPSSGREAGSELSERVSDHWHNVSSAVAFTLLLAGILLVSVSLLKEGEVKRLGQSGILLFPVMVILLALTYKGRFYNGSWQRIAFLLLFSWILFGAICFRKNRPRVESHFTD